MAAEDLDATVNLNARVDTSGGAAAAYGEQDHLAQMEAQQAAPAWASGKVTLSTAGTPFTGSRFGGDPAPIVSASAGMSRAEAMAMVMDEWNATTPPPKIFSGAEQSSPWADFRNGRADAGFASRVADSSGPWNTPPPAAAPIMEDTPPPPPRFNTFKEAQARAREIRGAYEDIYAGEGRAHEIGSPAFTREVQSGQAEEGLAVAPEVEEAETAAKTAAREALNRRKQFGQTVGYAAMQLLIFQIPVVNGFCRFRRIAFSTKRLNVADVA